ncbi:hypothetical protein ACF0H5_010048 [Mactra antiquata]
MEQPLKELSQVQNDLYERRKVKNDDTPEVLYERRKNDDDDDEVKRKEEKEDEVTVAYETLEHELTVAYDTVENELVDAVLKCMRLKATIARSCQMLKTMKEKKQELKIQYVLYEKRRKEGARKRLKLKAAVIKREAEPNPGTHWLEFQILSIISIISSVTTVLTLYCIQRRHDLKYDQPVLIVSGLFSVLSCTTLLIPEVKTWFVNNSATLVTAWSRTIAFLGTLMQFITTIILLFAIYRTRISKLERDRKHERRRREMIKTRVIVVTDENPWSTNVEQTRTSDENIQNVPMTLVAHEIRHNKTKTGESQPRKNTQESFADFTNNEIINPDKDEITTATENVGPDFNQSSEETKSNLDNSRPSKVKDISQSNVNNDPFSLSNESTI